MSEQVVVPEGIYLEALPAYSPELQPAERLWQLLAICQLAISATTP
jgi:transposase